MQRLEGMREGPHGLSPLPCPRQRPTALPPRHASKPGQGGARQGLLCCGGLLCRSLRTSLRGWGLQRRLVLQQCCVVVQCSNAWRLVKPEVKHRLVLMPTSCVASEEVGVKVSAVAGRL